MNHRPRRYTIYVFIGRDTEAGPMEYVGLDEVNLRLHPGRSLKAPSRAKVRWTSVDGDFEIQFEDNQLFESGRGPVLGASQGDATDYITLPIAESTQRLKYTARVRTKDGCVEEDPQIYIDDSSFRDFF
jgi:hypothetical protein